MFPRRLALAKAWTGPKPYEGFLVGLPLEVGKGGPRPGDLERVAEIAREIEEAAVGGDFSAAVLADLAAVDLLVGDAGLAVDRLEKAVSLASPQEKAIFLSDLAAACLTRARESQDPASDFLCALQKALQALEREPRLREAWCNRALASEGLGLKRQALVSWKACWDGGEEGPFGWNQLSFRMVRNRPVKTGAVQPLERMERVAHSGDATALEEEVAASPSTARSLTWKAMERWAAALLAGEAVPAAEALTLASRLGEAQARRLGDVFVHDVVAGIAGSSGATHRLAVARGIDGCRRGGELYADSNYLAASQAYEAARRELLAAGSPYAARAAYGTALSDNYRHRSLQESALLTLREVEREARRRGYLGLVADSLWLIGMFETSHPARALAAYEQALDVYEAMGNRDGVAGAKNMISELLDELGAVQEAWRVRQEILGEIDRVTSPQRLYQIFMIAAKAAYEQGMPEVAFAFQSEAVRAAREVGASALAEALVWRGRIHRSLGRTAAGDEDLVSAWAVAATIEDAAGRNRVESDLMLAEAEWALERSPLRVVNLLNAAFAHFERLGHDAHQLDALLLRARAFRARGDHRRATADLAEAERSIEKWRADLSQDTFRLSFLDTAQAVYDELILLYAEDLDHPSAALDALERKRARGFFDRVQRSAAQRGSGKPLDTPLPVEEWAPRLPAGKVLLSYARIGDRVLVWVVDRDGVRDFRFLEGASGMAVAVQRILTAAQAGPAAARPVQKEADALYDALIRLVAPFLPVGAEVVLSRDDFLAALPFALLRDRATGRYLVEDHALVTVPSANCYLAGRPEARARRRGAVESALFVGNPRFDRTAFRDLTDLPGSFIEAQAAAEVYGGGGKILTGSKATAAAFLAEAGQHEVVQFSGHAVQDARSAGEPALVLAPSAGRDGRVVAEEIARLDLSATRLVVLSACSSAGAPASRSEGSRSLARAFLAAGADTVVGSLWDIEDQSSKALLVEFHRHLRGGGDPAAALRAAQLHLLREGSRAGGSPLIWGAFEMSTTAP